MKMQKLSERCVNKNLFPGNDSLIINRNILFEVISISRTFDVHQAVQIGFSSNGMRILIGY